MKKKQNNNLPTCFSDHMYFPQGAILENSVVSHLETKDYNRVYNKHGMVTLISQKDIQKHSSCLLFGAFNLSAIVIYPVLGPLPHIQFWKHTKLVLPQSLCMCGFTAQNTLITLLAVSFSTTFKSLLHVSPNKRSSFPIQFKASSPISSYRLFCSCMTVTVTGNMQCVLPIYQTRFQVSCRYQFI